MTREEHVEWCKARAMKYLDHGDVANAVTSMMSDLSKHPDTKAHSVFMGLLGMQIMLDEDMEAARRFIKGFR
jgi:hypothetical protein